MSIMHVTFFFSFFIFIFFLTVHFLILLVPSLQKIFCPLGRSVTCTCYWHRSERHKRRRLAARQDDPNVCQSINNESDDTLSENEPVQISASHSAPSVSDNALYNDEESTADVHEDTFNGDEEADDNEGIAEEEVQEQEVNTDGGDDDEENEGNDADNTDAHSNENISNFENDNVPQNLNDLKLKALKQLFLLANLKHKQGNILLKTLHEFPFNLTFLPKDTRTLLETPTDVASRHVQYIDGGEYLHLGLQYTLIKKLKTLPEDILPETIQIDFSTDGAQIHKSGTTQFWPLQYRIYNCIDKKPIIAGVFKGTEKPSNPFQFFEHFVQELEEIREEGGVLINDRRYLIQIRCFIADAPARAFALNHYGHVSSNACSKCKIEGRRSAAMPFFRGTMIFPGTRHPLRTDQEYSELMDEDHHKGPSPLNRVLGLVTQVPFEPLHLLYIGNVKKVLTTHIHGKYGHEKLTKRKLDILDSRMMECRIYCPTEFNRRPNKISMFHHFKGTEFRQLLLYTAPAVLENVFDEDHYKHFLLLHCVMRLLSLENVSDEMYVYCQAALKSYVNMCEELYGEQFLSYNVHGLLHVVGDVRRLGPLDSYSAFCYENNMPEFRKFIRKPHLALQQFYKRMCELNDLVTPVDKGIHIRCSKIHMDGPLVEPVITGNIEKCNLEI
ncbi:uncharacterized protein [Temnothorax nylanderi]|uniref:uncharacterized protein isoform X1 n=1 Tax=Temnothorax nylanderi TaxID=102681 RepID=UPI003A89A474